MLILHQCLVATAWLILSAILSSANQTHTDFVPDSHSYHKIIQNGMNVATSHRSQPIVWSPDHLLTQKKNSQLPLELDGLYQLLLDKGDAILSAASEKDDGTNPCLDSLIQYGGDLLHNKPLAKAMFDATGKLPSGVALGDLNWAGSYDLCLNTSGSMNMSGQNTSSLVQGRYCNAYFNISSQSLPLTGSMFLTLGLCVPDVCDAKELNFLIFAVLMPEIEKYLGNETETYLKMFKGIACNHVEYSATPETVAAIVICSLFAILIIVGTLFDVFYHQPAVYTPESSSDSMEEHGSSIHVDEVEPVNSVSYSDSTQILGDGRQLITLTIKHKGRIHGIIGRILLAFSISTNGSKLLDATTGRDTVLAVNGMRVLSMAWVILGHTYFFGLSTGMRNLLSMFGFLKRWTFQAVMTGIYAVDTFFFLSGFLVAYLTLKELKKTGGKLNWFKFYLHRFLRLTPAYMLIILLNTAFFQYWGDGPNWPVHSVDYQNCKNYWWRNLLYIQNFFPITESCIGWAWYLANDMQMFWISPLVIYPLYRKPVVGYVVVCCLLLMQFLFRGFISVHYGLHLGGPDLTQQNDWFTNVYQRPYARIGPYLVGMMTGYVLVTTDRNIRLPKVAVLAGWALSVICILSLTYGPYEENQGHLNSIYVDAFHNSICKVVWGLALAWIVIACNTGHGGLITRLLSWSVWGPLGRLTYCAYLIHPIMMYVYYLSQRYPSYFMDINAIYMFLGHWCMTYAAAFVASLAFESPIIGIEKMVMHKRSSTFTMKSEVQ